ncbi:uncharacterized protein C18orf63-like [Linepithema humile]|uniref:uncharacterized protein C18orf63-like n=1 Tax=Linepithema humile TaxID=83485 RepID=UPI00351F1750
MISFSILLSNKDIFEIMASIVKIFNITIPQKNNLSCAICRIVNTENDPLMYSKFHAKKLKCRQFLQETPQAMAAPVVNRKILESGGSIYIIVVKDLFENYTFQDHCDSLNIQVMDLLDPIPTYIYKACLLYTMEYKLAPQWNKVGLYLAEGPDFLSSAGSINAITLNIKEIRDNSARIHVEAVNLKIPFLRLNTARPLQHDLQPPVRVLPSMKMANVLRISKIIKEKYLFKDYEDVRAYWKNMHGYILPDYKEGLLFYDIEFFYFKSNIFLYPETCLASGPLKILPLTTDPVSIIYKFVGDVKGRVVKLCGQQLDICPENTYQATVLAYTPASRIAGFSTCDTGYGTQSRRTSRTTHLSRMPDTCDIPTKRTRLSLSNIDDYLTCKSEIDDFDFTIGPARCSTSNFKPLKIADKCSAMLCDGDSVATSESIVQRDKNKSHYFEQKKKEIENKSSMELSGKEGKPCKLNLKEKLLRNF